MLDSITGPQLGLIGGIVGTAIGVAGGAIGTYCSVKNTNSPLERKFMIKASIWAWIAGTIFLGMLIGLPSPYRFLVWIPYGFLLPVGIRYINSRQTQIRAMDDSSQDNLPA